MLMRYSMHSSPAYFSSSFSGPLAYAQRQDRSRPRRLSCIVLRNDKSDRTFLGNMTLNGNRLVINNDGRDILNGTQVLEFGEIHTQVIAVEALDDSAVWLVGRRSDGRIDLHRLDEQGSHRVASLAGPLRWMIARQVGLLLVLVAAVPALLFVIVGFGLVRGRVDRTYSFGHRTVQLAPVGRRGLARLIDVAVILLPLAAGLWLSPEFGTWWSKCHGIVVSEKGWFLQLRVPNGAIRWTEARQLAQRVPWRFFELMHAAPVGWLAAALSGAGMVASCVAKARWGMALGGWLCGVRVWRKTLRPCGLPRCLLRELFLIGESLGGWLWLSPLLMLALSNQSRRWGDRISDTIVVRTDRVGSKNVRTESRVE